MNRMKLPWKKIGILLLVFSGYATAAGFVLPEDSYNNIIYPLTIVPAIGFALFWGPVAGGGTALGFAALNAMLLHIRSPEYLTHGLIGFLMGHFNVLLAAVLVGYVSRLWRLYNAEIEKRREAEEQLNAAIEMKGLLIREIHHRINNHLNMLARMVELQTLFIEEESNKKKFDEIYERIITISLIHQQLSHTNDREDVDVSAYIPTLLSRMEDTFKSGTANITLSSRIAKIYLPADLTTPLGLIIAELVTNAYKYAFPNNRDGIIDVRVSRINEEEIECVVANNGVPIPEDIEINSQRETLGLNMIRVFSEQIKGTIEIDRSEGTKFILRFPLGANKIEANKRDHLKERGIAEKDKVVDNPEDSGSLHLKVSDV